MNQTQEMTPWQTHEDALRQGRFLFQVASDGSAVFYPRVCAPGTGDTQLRWQESALQGTLYSYSELPGGSAPSIVALVDLDDGFRIMGNLSPALPIANQSVIGTRVQGHIDTAGALPRVVFAAMGAAS
ncbi:Zn-ribbon domain-containing OB-fold protein [Variovorax terrae]|uniref:OB-fold domain-containing protein n=1 Tax=Variovorax terrae TaxID=2923278 RepID=A0A9X2ALI9_9BURK|nr:OB-fold domain-containing protein [Variovorax terrae]MCJ0762364.1 OB-fold domain-containing protein [Variovorax terrae]